MSRLLIIAFYISCISVSTYGQSKKNNIKFIFSSSDSIQISSHEDLRVSTSSNGSAYYKKITINGKTNKAIIRELITLDKISRDSLSAILTTPNTDSILQDAQCFEPHHSILIFKKGKCSYFDICFGCRHFISSKDIKFEDDFLSNETWEKLELFFRNRNIKYEMPKEDSEEKN